MATINFNQKIVPFLWFNGQAKEAVHFYVSLFPNSVIEKIMLWGPGTPFPEDQVRYAGFNLCGSNLYAMDAPSKVSFNNSISFFVHCADQAEIDKYYDALSSNGGQEQACGWVTDRFGLSWQIVPLRFNQMMSSGSLAQVSAVMQAMMRMKKFIIADLENAFANAK
jgi:predicted 3-demethylubiquinone-9 3-methyltransferase (glyoxalase superfamily)